MASVMFADDLGDPDTIQDQFASICDELLFTSGAEELVVSTPVAPTTSSFDELFREQQRQNQSYLSTAVDQSVPLPSVQVVCATEEEPVAVDFGSPTSIFDTDLVQSNEVVYDNVVFHQQQHPSSSFNYNNSMAPYEPSAVYQPPHYPSMQHSQLSPPIFAPQNRHYAGLELPTTEGAAIHYDTAMNERHLMPQQQYVYYDENEQNQLFYPQPYLQPYPGYPQDRGQYANGVYRPNYVGLPQAQLPQPIYPVAYRPATVSQSRLHYAHSSSANHLYQPYPPVTGGVSRSVRAVKPQPQRGVAAVQQRGQRYDPMYDEVDYGVDGAGGMQYDDMVYQQQPIYRQSLSEALRPQFPSSGMPVRLAPTAPAGSNRCYQCPTSSAPPVSIGERIRPRAPARLSYSMDSSQVSEKSGSIANDKEPQLVRIGPNLYRKIFNNNTADLGPPVGSASNRTTTLLHNKRPYQRRPVSQQQPTVQPTLVVSVAPPSEEPLPPVANKPPPTPPPPPEPWWKTDSKTLWRVLLRHCAQHQLMTRDFLLRTVSLVCREWCDTVEGFDDLCETIDLNGKQNLTTEQWIGVGKRRPKTLNIAWSGVSKSELSSVLQFDDRLESLSLAGCHFSSVIALKNLKSARLAELDLRWVQGCTDASFKSLVTDVDAVRLKKLQCLYLSGCEVGDSTARLLANQFRALKQLDLSYCTRVTNLTLDVLSAAGCQARRLLHSLNLSGCTALKPDELFGPIQKLTNLTKLDLRSCTNVTKEHCQNFEQACAALGRTLRVLC